MDETLRIAMATDDNYVPFTGISLYSLFENNRDFDAIVIYILDNGISHEGKKKLNDIALLFHRTVEFIDCSQIGNWLGDEIMEMFRSEKTNVPISSYARLFLPDLLPENIEKVLYLDVDSVTIGSFRELWSQKIEDCSVLGVRDNVSIEAKNRVGLSSDASYINAGVLMMNLRKLREMGFIGKMRSFIHKYNGRVFHHDQGVINGLLFDSIGFLPLKYNMMSFVFESNSSNEISLKYSLPEFYSEEEYQSAKRTPVFLHYTEGNLQRPWVEHCRHPMKEKWFEYRDKTDWKDMPLKPDTRSAKLKLLAWMNLNLPVKVTKLLLSLVSK